MPDETLHVDPLLSYARREGAAVEVVLVLPDATLDAGTVRLRLRAVEGEAVHRIPATAEPRPHGGTLVRAVLPREDADHQGGERSGDQVHDGTWRLHLRQGSDHPLLNLRTRLVLHRDRPVALLPSFAPATLGN